MKKISLALLCTLITTAALSSDVSQWELRTSQGEMVLPDIFYSENFQNEQLSPLELEDGKYLIKDIIYPTIGNPNLYTRSDIKDELLIVMRSNLGNVAPLFKDTRESLTWANDFDQTPGANLELSDDSSLKVYLVRKNLRPFTSGAKIIPIKGGINRIVPSRIFVHDQLDYPDAFNERHTYRLIFNQKSLENVKAGLYDLRIEYELDDGTPYSEFQYNAVHISNKSPTNNFDVINIADTQVSQHMGILTRISPQRKSDRQFQEFANFVNSTKESQIRGAEFILSNGDMMNGGGFGLFSAQKIFFNYSDEAGAVFKTVKKLNYPTFLLPGNHDGHVSFGYTPKFSSKRKKMGTFVMAARELDSQKGNILHRFLEGVFPDKYSGHRVDIFSGKYMRKGDSDSIEDSYVFLKEEDRNVVVYDGFNHWRKNFGPLNYSFKYGNHYFIGVNSFDLRQHRRTGFGQYIANYGGMIGPAQMEWLKKEVEFATNQGFSISIISHHDPRGGEKSEWQGHYYYKNIFGGIKNNIWSYIKYVPPLAGPKCREKGKCFEGGLQEWMLPDPGLDCKDQYVVKGQLRCDHRAATYADELNFSGIDFVSLLAKSKKVRTIIMGHAHENIFHLSQYGDNLLPDHSPHGFHKRDIINDEHRDLLHALNQKLKSTDSELESDDLTWVKTAATCSITNVRYKRLKKTLGFSLFKYRESDDDGSILDEVDFYQNTRKSTFQKLYTYKINRLDYKVNKTRHKLLPRKCFKERNADKKKCHTGEI
ncbi:MAG: metallophosphoesterase [Bacteriovoracaceae bacterium]|jgi:hypothetical protein|nr:metallophosphoesterase [Bacteriovoracaceae bacterium]